MFNMKKIIGAALLVSATAMPVHAGLVLDTFDNYSAPIDLLNEGGANPVSTTSVINLSNGVAVDYTLDADAVENSADNTTSSTNSTQNGRLSYGSDNTGGVLSIKYYDPDTAVGSGFAAEDGNSVDFTAFGDSFYVTFFDAIDSGASSSIDVTLTMEWWTGIANDVESYMFSVADGTSGVLTIGFNNFANVDFTRAVSSMISIASAENADYDLSEVGIVPEPASIAILSLALLGLGLRSRKKSA
jgi:hypothetical protein